MAMGDFPAVLQCIQSRCRIAERSERVGLERSAAEMLEHLGRHDEAVDHAAQALLLAPDEQSSLSGPCPGAGTGCRRRFSDHLLAAAETSGRIDWALKSLTLLADEPRRARALELISTSSLSIRCSRPSTPSRPCTPSLGRRCSSC